MHMGWVRDGTGATQLQMAVLVTPNESFGTAYMAGDPSRSGICSYTRQSPADRATSGTRAKSKKAVQSPLDGAMRCRHLAPLPQSRVSPDSRRVHAAVVTFPGLAAGDCGKQGSDRDRDQGDRAANGQ